MSGVSGIVLAGGRSSRFGRDKLAEPVDDVPLLARAVAVVGAVADEVIVVLAPGAAEPDLPAAVRFARDRELFGGPLVGLLAGIEAASHLRAMVVGGDMPSLIPDVLELMLAGLDDHAAVLLEDAGERRSLPLAVRRDDGLTATRRALASGRRALLAAVDELQAHAIDEAAWRQLDPDGRTLRDIDRPADV